MGEISIIGLDLAKLVFQVHGADKAGRCVLRKQLKRHEVLRFFAGLSPCLVAMEACGSAHYWASVGTTRGCCLRPMSSLT